MAESKIKAELEKMHYPLWMMLFAIPKPRCKFYIYCTSYRKESYTCTNGGGNYCGIYRYLQKNGKIIQNH